MARVPVYLGGTVQREGATGARLRPAETSVDIGASFQSVSRALQNEGQVRIVEVEEQRQVDRMRLTTEFLARQDNLNRRLTALRDNAAAGASGHVESVSGAVDQETAPFIEGISDPVLRREFEQRAAALRTTTLDAERNYASAARQRALADNTQAAIEVGANRLQTDPSPATLRQVRDELRASLDTMTDMPEDVRTQLRQRINQSTALGFLVGLGEQNPAAALETVRTGLFDTDLSPEQRRQMQDRFSTEVQQRQNQARASARSTIEILQRRIRDHDPTLTDADLEQAQQLATAAGLPTQEYDIAKARVEVDIDRRYRTATGLEISAAVRELDARITQQGEAASPEDVIRRDRLQSLLARRQQQDQNDPLSSYAQRGGVLAPVNFSDPGSIRARIQASRTAEQQTGYFSFFTPQEAPLLQQRMASGPNGRLAVANEIAAIGAVDSLAAIRAAQQIAPNDGAFRQAVRLSPGIRAMVIRGSEARATIQRQLTLADGTRTSFDNATQQWFAANVEPILTRSQPEFVNDTREAARSLYAESLRVAGASGATEFSDSLFRNAVHHALGGSGRGGGLGRYQYGPQVQGQAPTIILPGGMTQSEFDRRIANMPTFVNRVRDWRGAANGAPVWSDGSDVSTEDIRRRFVPTAIRDGVYQFEWRGRILMTRENRPFEIDVRRLPLSGGAAASGQSTPIRRVVRPRSRQERTLSR